MRAFRAVSGLVPLRIRAMSASQQLNSFSNATTELRLFDAKRLASQKLIDLGVAVSSTHPAEAKTAVVFLSKDEVKAKDASRLTSLGVSVAAEFFEDFSGKVKSSRLLYTSGDAKVQRVLAIGVGSIRRVDHQSLRMAVHTAVTSLKELKVQDAAFYMPANVVSANVDLLVRNTILSAHKFDKYYKKNSSIDTPPFKSFTFVVDGAVENADSLTIRAKTIANAVLLCRELQNERADVCNPDYMQMIAEEIVANSHGKVKLDVYDESRMEQLGLTLCRAVGQSAKSRPRILVLSYFGRPDTTDADKAAGVVDFACIGKGITYDTGGLNIKGTGFMETMHLDMSGSAVSISTIKAVSELNLKVNMISVLTLAENAIDALSYKPHSIYMTHKGAVEISNTDAEGRLALVDAFWVAQHQYKPRQMVDLATLTGACVVALGEYQAGLFTDDEKFCHALRSAADANFERVWPMPMLRRGEDFDAELGAKQSDMKSMGNGRNGGASLAACFLRRWVEKGVSWAHLDIAGPAALSAPRESVLPTVLSPQSSLTVLFAYSHYPFGGTGMYVSTLVSYLETVQEHGVVASPAEVLSDDE